MNFIPVTADQCNVQGLTNRAVPRSNLRLNKDLIAAINGQDVHIKGGNILNAGGFTLQISDLVKI